ncbi:MAG: FtsX-like permease family protein [Actinomycetota bacterium]
MAAVWMRLRAELRARWRAMLGLAVLLGIMAGAATAAAAGARRTETAYPRFFERYRVHDVTLTTGAHPRHEEIFKIAARLPRVEATFRGSVYPGTVRTVDGLELAFPELFFIADHERHPGLQIGKVLDGRMSDPTAADEAMVNYAMAERLGIEAGDVVTITLLGAADGEAAPPPQELSVTVTAVVAIAGHFEQVDGSGFTRTFHMTPAFQQRWGAYSFRNDDNFSIRLDDPTRADDYVYALNDEFQFTHQQIVDPLDGPPTLTYQEARGVQGLNHVPALALWLLSAFIAITTTAVFTQLLAREHRLGDPDHPALRSLGMTRADLWAVSLFRSILIAVVGAVISIGVAWALSPLTPVGLARIAEPDPGFLFAPRVIAVGAAAAILVISIAGASVAWLTTGRVRRVRTQRSEYPAALSVRLSRAPIALGARSGLTLALDAGRGDRATPVRTALLGTTIASAALVAALTFAGSLRHLIGDPKLAGYTWDAGAIAAAFDEQTPPSALIQRMEGSVAKRFPDAKLWHGSVFATAVVSARVDGVVSRVDITAQVSDGPPPSIIEGRAPRTSTEVAIDRRTLEELDKALGGTVEVAPSLEKSAYSMRIVGILAVPRIAFQATKPGQALALTTEGARRIDPDNDYGEALYIDFANDADLLRDVSAVREAAGPDAFAVLSRDESPMVGNVERISSLPTMVAVLTGFLGMATLAHALTTTIRRRRKDLAILRTIGLVGRQIRGIVAWQSTALVAGALIVGVPLGILAGRWGWRIFAEELEVVPVPVVSPAVILAVATGAFLAGNLIAILPARAAANTEPAFVLRTE